MQVLIEAGADVHDDGCQAKPPCMAARQGPVVERSVEREGEKADDRGVAEPIGAGKAPRDRGDAVRTGERGDVAVMAA